MESTKDLQKKEPTSYFLWLRLFSNHIWAALYSFLGGFTSVEEVMTRKVKGWGVKLNLSYPYHTVWKVKLIGKMNLRINPFVPNAPFVYPWKHKKTVMFCDSFRGWTKCALKTNGLRQKQDQWMKMDNRDM